MDGKRFLLKCFSDLVSCVRGGHGFLPAAALERTPKILVIRRNRMGDMICTLPMLRQLRKYFPQAWIRIVCDREGEPIARASGLCDEVILFEKAGGRYLQIFQNAHHVRGFDYTFAVKVGFDTLSAVLSRVSASARRMGFVPASDPELEQRFFFTDPVEIPSQKEHQAVSCMRLILPLGIPEGAYDFRIKVDRPYERFAAEVMGFKGFEEKNFCVVSLSTNQEDRWPLVNFKALCQCIKSELGYKIMITSTPADRGMARDLVRLCDDESAIVSIDTPGVLHLAALVSKARFVIAFEGGVAHLSTACDIPGVILWRKNAPFEKWKALSSKHRYVRGDPVSEISVSEVLHAVRELLHETEP